MLKPRIDIAAVILIAAILSGSSFTALNGFSVCAQQTQTAAIADTKDRERGLELFRQGKTKEAIKALREAAQKHKDDAEAWHFLGAALFQADDLKGARKAFETALQLRPDFAQTHYNLAFVLLLTNKTTEAAVEARRALELDSNLAEAHYVLGMTYLRERSHHQALDEAESVLKLKPAFALGHLLKSQTLLGMYSDRVGRASQVIYATRPDEAALAVLKIEAQKRAVLLREAADSLEQYLKLAPKDKASATWREQLETLRVYARPAMKDQPDSERTIFPASEVTTKARILSKPEPQYSAQARQAQVEGTVILRAVFAADGQMKHILVLRSLPYGLTEEAIRAARKIRFQPAIKDGRPVSQFIQIEYNFSLY